jgi:hypothetical protein
MKNAPACRKTKLLFLKFGLKRGGLTDWLSGSGGMGKTSQLLLYISGKLRLRGAA